MIDQLRQQMTGIPWAVREALLGNVVVGTFTSQAALCIARALRQRYEGIQLELPL